MFRRRHQTLSRAVSKVDEFIRLSNVAGFVCHIVNIILLLYSVIFHPESTKAVMSALSFVNWLWANINGLLFSASAGIIVNHMVRNYVLCIARVYNTTRGTISYQVNGYIPC